MTTRRGAIIGRVRAASRIDAERRLAAVEPVDVERTQALVDGLLELPAQLDLLILVVSEDQIDRVELPGRNLLDAPRRASRSPIRRLRGWS